MNTDKNNTQLPQSSVMQSVIKGQHLRIGNLLYFNGNHNEIGVVSEIFKNDLANVSPYKIGINHRIDIYYDIERLKPIQLTEKWLLDFGFVKRFFNNDENKPIWWKVEGNRHIDIYFEKQVNAFVFLINSVQYSSNLDYVHQIQNLHFALTQRELTVA